jgi:hypothetical protein
MRTAMWIVGGIWGKGFAIMALWAIYYRLQMMGNLAPGVPWWKNAVGAPMLDPTLFNARGEAYRRKLVTLVIVMATYFLICGAIMIVLYDIDWHRAH